MTYGKKKINNGLVFLILIMAVGMAGCVWVLISTISETGGGNYQTLTDKERAAITKRKGI